MIEIRTERLVLRGWRDSDLAPWAAMNADPQVREFLGPPLTAEESAASARRFQADLDAKGYGFWAVEVRDTGEFVGFVGLDDVDEGMPLTGVEVGWRLARPAWGHGYATEGAHAALRHGFDDLGLPEIVAITAAGNVRSQAVMRRLGMTTDSGEDFDDPEVESGPLRRSVLYRRRADS
ncbi:GNAT family N-acetyltransferase [Micromonospora sp. NBC_01405]|uniref:GNAT family N-acetyltransferase n=1 Tax=Micromonospora sp. NBC_01405 TaxID=2903589 RepID=UPI003250D929